MSFILGHDMQGIEYVSHCHSYLLEHGDVAEAHATALN